MASNESQQILRGLLTNSTNTGGSQFHEALLCLTVLVRTLHRNHQKPFPATTLRALSAVAEGVTESTGRDWALRALVKSLFVNNRCAVGDLLCLGVTRAARIKCASILGESRKFQSR